MGIKVGDSIAFDGSRGFNHGCRDGADFVVLAVHEDRVDVEVTGVSTCHSCWQVGHDQAHRHPWSESEEGDVISIALDDLSLQWDGMYKEDRWFVR